jgi:hypothetical protein
MYIEIPPNKLEKLKQIAQEKKSLRKQLDEAMVTIEHIRSLMQEFPTARALAAELGIPVNTVQQILAGRAYKIGQSIPTKFRATNRELARRADASRRS